MKKITLILGLIMLGAALPAMAGLTLGNETESMDQDGLDRPLVPDGSSDAERKFLNGEGYGKPGPLPADSPDLGNGRCRSEEDCEAGRSRSDALPDYEEIESQGDEDL